MPVCITCKTDKPVDMFPRNGYDELGFEKRRRDCTQCYNITRKTNSKKGKATLRKFVNNTYHRTGEVAQLSHNDWRDVVIYFDGCCAYCGKKSSRSVKLTKDHIVPVLAGGTTCRYNIVPACQTCNSSKGATAIGKWYIVQSFYDIRKHAKILTWSKEQRCAAPEVLHNKCREVPRGSSRTK